MDSSLTCIRGFGRELVNNLCTVFSLHDSREALAKIKEWMKTGSGTERVPFEDSSISSLQEWLVGFVDL